MGAAGNLTVFDGSGRLVKLLPAGEADATWDGCDSEGRVAGAGVYSVHAGGRLLRLVKAE